MLAPKYHAVLRIIHSHLRGRDLSWALTGSCGFALQGVPVEVHDIDIQTDERGAYAIARLLADYVMRPVAFSRAERIQSHFGVLAVEGVRVEIMGALSKRLPDGTWEPPVNPADHLRFVEIEQMRLPVLDLAYEYTAYLTLGRSDRAELLRQWLAHNVSGSFSPAESQD